MYAYFQWGIMKTEKGLEDLEADAVIALELKSTGYEQVVGIYVTKKQGQIECHYECGMNLGVP